MNDLTLWLLLQLGLEAGLIALVVVLLLKLRNLTPNPPRQAELPPEVQASMQRFLSQSEKLSASFNEALKQKKELSVSLILKLERKINDLNEMLSRAEEDLKQAEKSRGQSPDPEKANPAAPENRAMVLRLAEQGLSIEEIARRTKLNRGEVELILDLEKQIGL
jgi:DNA-binding NarL/FixJ family response regulator